MAIKTVESVFEKIKINKNIYYVSQRPGSACPMLVAFEVAKKELYGGEFISIYNKNDFQETLDYRKIFPSRRAARKYYKEALLNYKQQCIIQRDNYMRSVAAVDRKLEEVNWRLERIKQ